MRSVHQTLHALARGRVRDSHIERGARWRATMLWRIARQIPIDHVTWPQRALGQHIASRSRNWPAYRSKARRTIASLSP
jgi:hypothetical protein